MAEGNTVSPDNVVCRYFLNDACREGDSCPFSHDATRTKPDRVCRYYLLGKCLYDDTCMYDHINVKNTSSAKSHSRTDRHNGEYSKFRSENPRTEKRKEYHGKLNVLSKDSTKKEAPSTCYSGPGSASWVNAPEFVPKSRRSYAETVKSNFIVHEEPKKLPSSELCPYFLTGACPYDMQCSFVHGDLCDICDRACLHPYDAVQRRAHIEFCEKELEQDMELSFAVQRSVDKTCGICMDVIMEKEPISARRFGILEKCNHIFCLDCIRKWRQAKQIENSQHIDCVLDPVVTRACPECRVTSDFITPSLFWVDTEEEKSKLIKNYKEAMSKKPCRYFKQGEGNCPFGGACFYLHAKPDGTKVDLPLPSRRRRQNQDGEFDYMSRIFLWDYLEFREENILMHLELEDLMYDIWTDSEDADSVDSEPFGLN